MRQLESGNVEEALDNDGNAKRAGLPRTAIGLLCIQSIAKAGRAIKERQEMVPVTKEGN